MNRRDRKKEQTRSNLLEAAMAKFAKHGVYATRVEDITESVDVAKGVFYNYFDSKHQLIAELLSQGVELLEKSYFGKIDRRMKGKNRIRELLRQQESFWQAYPEYSLLFHQARGLLLLEGESPELKKAFQRYIRCFAQHIYADQKLDAKENELNLRKAVILAGLIAGYRSFAQAVGFSIDLEYVIQAAVSGVNRTAKFIHSSKPICSFPQNPVHHLPSKKGVRDLSRHRSSQLKDSSYG